MVEELAITGTLLNKKFLEIYEEMVKDLYVKPGQHEILRSFVLDDIVMGNEPGRSELGQPKSKKKKKECPDKKVAWLGIKTM